MFHYVVNVSLLTLSDIAVLVDLAYEDAYLITLFKYIDRVLIRWEFHSIVIVFAFDIIESWRMITHLPVWTGNSSCTNGNTRRPRF